MKVSVIIPVYNVEEYLSECLSLVAEQTLDDYEVILVNDGSTDGSEEICKTFVSKYNHIRLFSQENKGQSAARNFALTKAQGEYVLFVDSDDYITADALEILYNTAKKKDVDIVVGDLINEQDEIKNDPRFRWLPCENEKVGMIEYARDALEYGVYDIVPWIKLTKRQFLIDNNIFFPEGYYYEDQEYTMKLSTCKTGSIIKIRFPFYFYRINRPGSTTTYTSRKKADDFLNIIKRMHGICNGLDKNCVDVGEKILGIAYYHFAQVWLKLKGKDQKEMHSQFCALENTYSFKSVINVIPNELKTTVIRFRYRPNVLRLKYNAKKFIRNILKR